MKLAEPPAPARPCAPGRWSDPKTAVGLDTQQPLGQGVRCSSTAHHGACSTEHQNSGTATPICSFPPSAAACTGTVGGELLSRGSWLLLSLVHHQTLLEQVGGENQWSYKSLLQTKCPIFRVPLFQDHSDTRGLKSH